MLKSAQNFEMERRCEQLSLVMPRRAAVGQQSLAQPMLEQFVVGRLFNKVV